MRCESRCSGSPKSIGHGGAGFRTEIVALLVAVAALPACRAVEPPTSGEPGGARRSEAEARPPPRYVLTADRTHNRFSAAIPPAIRVPSGAVVEAYTKEASDGQITPDSGPEALLSLDFDRIHPLTGPVYVEGADPGDVLAVTLLEVEVGTWGWTAVVPGFGFLSEEFGEPWLKTFRFAPGDSVARFEGGLEIPLRPFPGVMGVAPPTDSMLSTIPPRANGGNMDDRRLVEGATVYFPVFVEGALFSIGDTHAAQGDGEVSGTAIEAPMRVVFRVRVIEGGRRIREPEYETDEFYAVTAFAPTLDEAARKATRYMVDYLVEEHGLEPTAAYVLCSLAGELKISEVVDVPHVLVSMHLPKRVLRGGAAPSG